MTKYQEVVKIDPDPERFEAQDNPMSRRARAGQAVRHLAEMATSNVLELTKYAAEQKAATQIAHKEQAESAERPLFPSLKS